MCQSGAYKSSSYNFSATRTDVTEQKTYSSTYKYSSICGIMRTTCFYRATSWHSNFSGMGTQARTNRLVAENLPPQRSCSIQ